MTTKPTSNDTRTVDDEEIWVDLEKGEFFGLNESAARILELVREGITEPKKIAEKLVAEFDVTPDEAESAVTTLLEEARHEAQKLLTTDPGLKNPDHARLCRMAMTRYGQALDLGDVG